MSEKRTGLNTDRFILERRRDPDNRSGSSGSKSDTGTRAIASSRRFLKNLNQCLRTYRKTGRDFSLGLLVVLQWRKLEETGETALKNSLIRALKEKVPALLRDRDTVTCPAPAEFLVLMPGTGPADADAACQRLATAIAGLPLGTGGNNFMPACRVEVISASALADPDFRTLLGALSVDLVGDGDLSVGKGPGRAFSGSLKQWQLRFRVPETTGECYFGEDLWGDGSAVLIRVVPGPFATGSDEFLERLRVLQSLSNPGIEPLLDFHLDLEEESEARIFLVNRVPSPVELNAGCAAGVDPGACVKAVCARLTYLWSLVPPVVPSRFADLRIYLTDEGVKLLGYDLDFVLGRAPSPDCQSALVSELAAFGLALSARTGITLACDSLLQELAAGNVPEELATLSRFKAALKDLL
ncbi:MAG: GGDEF domain-containing protein [Candidatus Melainabacteria bacterium]|nr:GGDEF domain-containing protein [Candidatus Melainabacteria bacterium]